MKKIITTLVLVFFTILASFGQLKIEIPTLTAPNDQATDQMPNVLLDWSAELGATGYHILVALDEDFNNMVVDSVAHCTAIENQFLNFNTTYYWKVRAIEGTAFSDFTETRSFTTFEKIGLRRPSNGSGNHEVEVELEWLEKVGGNNLSGFTRYQIQVDTANIFEAKSGFGKTDPIWDFKVNFGTLKYKINGLYFGKTMYWRARAIHQNDTSAWSEPFSFITKDQITLDKPNNNSTNQDIFFDLKWKEFKGCIEYEYQVHPNDNFGNAVIYLTEGISVEVPKVMFGQTYYWRVKGLNLRDTSEWSAPWNFETKAAVTLKEPADGLDSVALKPLLRWEQIKGSSCYNIEYADNPEFEGGVSVYQETTNSQTNPFYNVLLDLNEDTEYFWRIRACAPHDTSAFSPVWSFTTIAPVGINELFNNQNVTIAPNPSSGKAVLSIQMKSASTAGLQVLDLSGREMYSREILLSEGLNKINLDLQGFSKGVYLVNIKEDQNTFTTKLIIK